MDRKILIVGDHSELQVLLIQVPKGPGFHASMLSNSKSPTLVSNRLRPDLIILDNSLPDTEEWDTLPRRFPAGATREPAGIRATRLLHG